MGKPMIDFSCTPVVRVRYEDLGHAPPKLAEVEFFNAEKIEAFWDKQLLLSDTPENAVEFPPRISSLQPIQSNTDHVVRLEPDETVKACLWVREGTHFVQVFNEHFPFKVNASLLHQKTVRILRSGDGVTDYAKEIS
ncbi:MAG: hypothetical protein S4CHLAM37_09150 [Chlamydiia bacterium]|nr:hypothetical protein [Chlamydiia bacterium]